MSDNDPSKQLVPSQSNLDETDQLLECNNKLDAHLDEPTASICDINNQVPVEDAAPVMLSQNDLTFVRGVLGVETYLNAVTAGITPPAGAFSQPTIDPDETAAKTVKRSPEED